MITYETLRKIEQHERESSGLSKLPQNFLREVHEYLEKKGALSGEKGDDIEHKSAKLSFERIVQARERKIVNFTLSYVRSGAIPEDMTPEERELFDYVVSGLQDFQVKRQKMMTGEHTDMLTVAFLKEVPQFVGIDMAIYGPYRQGDIATVPVDNAKVITEKGLGEVVEP